MYGSGDLGKFWELELYVELPIRKQKKLIKQLAEHILKNTNSFIWETITDSLILGFFVSLSLSIF